MIPTNIKVEKPEIKILRRTAGKITPRDVIKRLKELQEDRIQNIRPGKSIKPISLADIYESFGFEYDERSREILDEIKFSTSSKKIRAYEFEGLRRKKMIRREGDPPPANQKNWVGPVKRVKTLEELAIDNGMCMSEFLPLKLREIKAERDLQEGRVKLKDIYDSLGIYCSEEELEIGEV